MDSIPTTRASNFGAPRGLRSDASGRSTEIETLRLNPFPPRTRRFQRDPANAEMISSESASVCEGGDACAKKTAGLRGGVCAPFSSACGLASIARVPIPRALFASFSGIRERSKWISLTQTETLPDGEERDIVEQSGSGLFNNYSARRL